MYRIKVEPHYYQAQGPPLSTRVSFVRIDPADWKLPQDNQTVSDLLFSVSSYILVLRYKFRLGQIGLVEWMKRHFLMV